MGRSSPIGMNGARVSSSSSSSIDRKVVIFLLLLLSMFRLMRDTPMALVECWISSSEAEAEAERHPS